MQIITADCISQSAVSVGDATMRAGETSNPECAYRF